jgi:1-deoxy-D-xylulose-5-phosphate reductoisomerase
MHHTTDHIKNIAVLGSTGSIGTQTLEVVNENPDKFRVSLLTANANANLLIAQALAFKPEHVAICDESKYQYVKDALAGQNIQVHTGHKAITELVTLPHLNMVLTAMLSR